MAEGDLLPSSAAKTEHTSGYMQIMPPDPTHKDCIHCVCQAGPTIGVIVHKLCCKCGERFAVDLTVTNPPLPFYPAPAPYPYYPAPSHPFQHPSSPGWPYAAPTIVWCAVDTRPGANC